MNKAIIAIGAARLVDAVKNGEPFLRGITAIKKEILRPRAPSYDHQRDQ